MKLYGSFHINVLLAPSVAYSVEVTLLLFEVRNSLELDQTTIIASEWIVSKMESDDLKMLPCVSKLLLKRYWTNLCVLPTVFITKLRTAEEFGGICEELSQINCLKPLHVKRCALCHFWILLSERFNDAAAPVARTSPGVRSFLYERSIGFTMVTSLCFGPSESSRE